MPQTRSLTLQSTTPAAWVGHLLALGWVMMWAPNFAILRSLELQHHVSPMAVVVLRFAIGVPIVFALWLFKRPDFSRLSRRGWLIVLVMFAVVGPIYHIILVRSVEHVQAGLTCVLMATMPVHVGWIGVWILGERFGWKSAAALAIALTGVILPVLFEQSISIENFTWDHVVGHDRSFKGLIFPLLVALNAVIAALNNVLVRYLRHQTSAWDLVCGQIVLTLPVTLLAAFAMRVDLIDQWSHLNTWGWVKAIYIGTISMHLMIWMIYRALQIISALATAFYTFLMMAFGWVWGWLMLDERMYPVHGFAMALVALGLLFNTWDSMRRAPSPDRPDPHSDSPT